MPCPARLLRGAGMTRARVSTTLLFLIFGIVEASWASRIPLIRTRLGLSDLGLSVALAGPAIGLLLAARGAPSVVARFRNGQAARAAAVASAAGLILPALAWNLLSLTVGLALWGACLGTLEITMNARGSALESTHDRSLLSGLHASYSLAVLGFSPVGALAARFQISPLLHFTVIAGACVVLALVLGPSPRDQLVPAPRPPAAREAPARAALTAHPTLVALAFIGFCALVAEGSVANWSGVLLRQNDHASLALAPFALTAFSSGMVAGRLSGDFLIMRHGHYPMVWRAAVLAAAGMTVGVATPSVAVAIVGYVALGLGLSVLIPIVFALSGRAPGVDPVWALSRMTTATYIGLFLGPPLIGVVSSAIGLRAALLGVAILLVGVAALGVAGARRSSGGGPADAISDR